MRALCVDSQRNLEVRDIPQPQHPPANHVLIRMDACTINSGDKSFFAHRRWAGHCKKRGMCRFQYSLATVRSVTTVVSPIGITRQREACPECRKHH
jgi:threonine dehydrogenase-like Zn-dependent dehydrogenase